MCAAAHEVISSSAAESIRRHRGSCVVLHKMHSCMQAHLARVSDIQAFQGGAPCGVRACSSRSQKLPMSLQHRRQGPKRDTYSYKHQPIREHYTTGKAAHFTPKHTGEHCDHPGPGEGFAQIE